MFTKTLICTEALPRMAGPMSTQHRAQAGMARNRSRAHNGNPAHQAGNLKQKLHQRRRTRRHKPCHRSAANSDLRAEPAAEDQTESDRADIEERGGERRNSELPARVQHTHGLRRQRHQQQKREHDAGETHGQFELARNLVKPDANSPPVAG